MGVCSTCGNDYRKSFRVIKDGREYDFDSLECAIEQLAPHCSACGCRVIGHGVEHGDIIYCSGHCARLDGVAGLVDHN